VYAITRKDAALVPIRATLGATMLYHGLPKLGGEGAEQAGQMFEQLGIKPGRTWAKLSGLAEVFGGATALIGFGTRIGALAVLATQLVAINKVHGSKGFSNVSGGYEFNLALMAIALGILVSGPGAVSLHEVVERRVQRRPWLLAPRRRRRAFDVAMLLK
jgi:putative oxidoreductase